MSNKEVGTDAAHEDELRDTVMQDTDFTDSGAYRLDTNFDDRSDPGQFFRHHGYLRRLHFLLESRLKTRYVLTSSIYNFKMGGLIHLKFTDNRPALDVAFRNFMRKVTKGHDEDVLPRVLKNLNAAAVDVEYRLGSDRQILNSPAVRYRWHTLQNEMTARARAQKPWTWTALIGCSVIVAKTTQDDRIWSESAAAEDAQAIFEACLA